MPQAVTSDVFHVPFALIEGQPLPDGLRVQRLPIYIYGEIGFVKTAVKLAVGEPEPVHVLLQIVYQRIRQRNVADGRLRLRLLFVVAELLGIQPVAPDVYDLLVKVDVRPFQPAHLAVADARQKDKLQDDFLVHFVVGYVLVQLAQEGAGLFYGKHFLFGNGAQRGVAFLGADLGCAYGILGDPLIADGFVEQRAQDTAVALDRFGGIGLFDDDRFKVFVIGKPAAVAERFRRFLCDVRSLFIKVIRGAAVDDILPRHLPESSPCLGSGFLRRALGALLYPGRRERRQKPLHVAHGDGGDGLVGQPVLFQKLAEDVFDLFGAFIVVDGKSGL